MALLCSRVGAACCPDGRRVASSFCCAGLLARRRRMGSTGSPGLAADTGGSRVNISLVRVRRGSPLPSPARVGAAFVRVPQLRRKRSGVLVPCSRRPRPPRPQTHGASAFPATFLLLRLSHGGFHAPGVPRSVRGVNLTCRISSFCLCLLLFWRCSLCAPRTRAVLQIQTRELASV